MSSLDHPADQVAEYVRSEVRGGFTPIHEIVDNAVEVFIDDADEEVVVERARRALELALTDLRAEEKSWPRSTDCDRLDAAFGALEREGIVARQNWTCCQTCGHYEIGEEVEVAAACGRDVQGYTFFHQQDTESAVDGHNLFLAFGAVEAGETAAATVAERVASTLREHGLAVEWDGSVRQRIHVEVDWKKRRLFD